MGSKRELEEARLTMPEDQYEQEVECSFQAAVSGAYYGKQIQKAEKDNRITDVEYDKNIDVETWWDLGIGDSTAIWFASIVCLHWYHLVLSLFRPHVKSRKVLRARTMC